MVTTTTDGEDTADLVRRGHTGDASDRTLFDRCYRELHALAQRQLARERRGHTLTPTSLVHEAFVRLHGSELPNEDRGRFLRLAARVMRHVLIDCARRRLRRDALGPAGPARDLDPTLRDPMLRLDAAMQRLEAIDDQLFAVVELRFLVGLSVEQTAEALGCGTATVKRDWRTARAFLLRELERDAS